MQEVVKRVLEQQKRMGYLQYIGESQENQMDYIRDITLSLIKETNEFLDEVPWKPWKHIEDQPYDKEAAVLEICDIIVFAAVLFISLNLPIYSLEEAMEATLTKIDDRIKDGYGRKE